MSVLRPALVVFVGLSLITGILYPFAVTGVSQVLFSEQAEGSLIKQNGKVVGSQLIGQLFTSEKYFWGRPSATSPEPYNAGASSGSNLGPLNPALHDAVKLRIASVRAAHPNQKGAVPVDLVTASASGLDPHISPAAALYQIERVAKARGMTNEALVALVERVTEPRTLGVLGEPVVNVLALNLALDKSLHFD